jgi:outer membrane protein assembly factor BamD (BamD/ComL family)
MMYRKVRILVQFAPEQVSDAVAALEKEFPNSKLLDDALAEEIFAEGVARKDVAGAEKTFRRLVDKYPNANAVDNAYTWMAIIYRCAGRPEDALKLNRDILRLFPTTRHARYATTRIAEPDAKSCRAWQTADQDSTK